MKNDYKNTIFKVIDLDCRTFDNSEGIIKLIREKFGFIDSYGINGGYALADCLKDLRRKRKEEGLIHMVLEENEVIILNVINISYNKEKLTSWLVRVVESVNGYFEATGYKPAILLNFTNKFNQFINE